MGLKRVMIVAIGGSILELSLIPFTATLFGLGDFVQPIMGVVLLGNMFVAILADYAYTKLKV